MLATRLYPKQSWRPKRHSTSENPLNTMSTDVLMVVVLMSLDAADMLKLDARRINKDSFGLRRFSLAEDLVSDAMRDPILGQHLFDEICGRLRRTSTVFSDYTIADLASLWSTDRHLLFGNALAGLLWAVAQLGEPAARQLERAVVSDLKYRAFMSLSRPMPQTNLATSN